MNETLYVSFHSELSSITEDILEKLDALLFENGWKYSGFRNMYLPTDKRKRDEAMWQVLHTLKHTSWLKEYKPQAFLGNMTNVCGLSQIDISSMSEPSKEKFQYYEDYYLRTGKLPHAIVVDENHLLRDGYTAYLLAQKYSISADVMEAWSWQPLKKLVYGKHVRQTDGTYQTKGSRIYCWNYELKHPVLPGDILKVKTKNGLDYIYVTNICYATGINECTAHRKVKKHMGSHISDRTTKDPAESNEEKA
ncbi:MAG: hypothetical protein KH828_11355 [Clostridiales bacterium]|nr:hypothetical protein [Clostridiales bacterium]